MHEPIPTLCEFGKQRQRELEVEAHRYRRELASVGAVAERRSRDMRNAVLSLAGAATITLLALQLLAL